MSDDVPVPYDLGTLPPPQEQDAHWAWRLWNTLQIADPAADIQGGIWDMPGVGRYRRTGLTELTLTEIHASMAPDHLGVTVWNKNDWILILAEIIGWAVVTDQVEKADQQEVPDDEDEPALEHIGKVHVCPCGTIYSLLGPDPELLRLKVSEEGHCLNPECDIIIPVPHAGVLNVVDNSAVIAKMEAQELLHIAIEEEEYQPEINSDYPSPPLEYDTQPQNEIFKNEEE